MERTSENGAVSGSDGRSADVPRKIFGVQPDDGPGMLEISLMRKRTPAVEYGVVGSNAAELDLNWLEVFTLFKAVAHFITPGIRPHRCSIVTDFCWSWLDEARLK